MEGSMDVLQQIMDGLMALKQMMDQAPDASPEAKDRIAAMIDEFGQIAEVVGGGPQQPQEIPSNQQSPVREMPASMT